MEHDIRIGALSLCGSRRENEDAVAWSRCAAGWHAVLADGAGGHERGAEASRLAVAHLQATLDESTAFTAEGLATAVRQAHAQLQRRQAHGSRKDSRRAMHTTVVVLAIDSAAAAALWCHVGDSRLYRVRSTRLECLTRDDSIVQQLLDAKLITPEKARRHPHRNQLVAALGMADDIEPHTPPAEPLRDGDALLLASDGWWDAIEEADADGLALARTLADAASPDDWLFRMQRRIEAMARPDQDNFSAIAVWVGEPEEVTRLLPAQEGTPSSE